MRRTLTMCVIIGSVLLAGYTTLFSNLSTSAVFGNQIEKITIEETATRTLVEITEEDEIKQILEDLQMKRWNRYYFNNLKLAPNVYLVINNRLVGLYETEENLAKIESSDKIGYYKIPDGIYDKIMKRLQETE